jgi:hypothetical protein
LTDNEIKKEYLKEYENLYHKYLSLEDQLQALREENESAKIQQLTDMPKAHRQSDLSDYMCRIEMLEEKAFKAEQACKNRRLDIEERITDMKIGLECAIIRKKYIELKKWEEICVEIGYSWRQTHRLHSNALKNFIMA